VPAIVQAWLPGEEGGEGIADVLLGDHNPSGRLPVSVAKNVGQLPVYYSRKPNSRNENHVYTDEGPALSVRSRAELHRLRVRPGLPLETEVGPADTVTASVTVENTGGVAGHEVVQLYTHQDNPSLARPVQELRGFERVHLEPGESATVNVTLSTAQLAFHDTDMDLVVEPDTYEVRVGRSAADIESTATFDVVGERYEVPTAGRAYFSESGVEE